VHALDGLNVVDARRPGTGQRARVSLREIAGNVNHIILLGVPVSVGLILHEY